jgi:hypothetical protein
LQEEVLQRALGDELKRQESGGSFFSIWPLIGGPTRKAAVDASLCLSADAESVAARGLKYSASTAE